MLKLNNFKCLVFVTMLCICSLATVHSDEKKPLNGGISVEVAVVNVGPIIPGALLRLETSIQFKDAVTRKRLGTMEQPWWKNIRIGFQELSEKSLQETQWHQPREATNFWRITPALDNPIETTQATGLESDILSKTFIAELHPAQVQPGTIYTLFAVLDTRAMAEQSKDVASLFVSQVGASLFQIQPQSAITDKQSHINFLTDKYYGELYRGNFEAAAEANQSAAELGLDPIVTKFKMVDILLYQGKHQEALIQYEKVLRMDSEAAKKNPQHERLVLPSTLAIFREKIQKNLQE